MTATHRLYRIAAWLLKVYWFVRRPRTTGVKCVIEHDGRWLMIRNSYGRRNWTFPGGRVHRNERPEDGARREALEEVGITLGSLRPIGTYQSHRQYKHDTVYCFHTVVPTAQHRIDGREVAEAQWFAPPDIPVPRGPAVERVLGWSRDFRRDSGSAEVSPADRPDS